MIEYKKTSKKDRFIECSLIVQHFFSIFAHASAENIMEREGQEGRGSSDMLIHHWNRAFTMNQIMGDPAKKESS